MKKILFCASTSSHLESFHLPYLKAFHERGWEIWTATEAAPPLPWVDHAAALPLRKRFLSPRNLWAILAARALLKREQFDLVSVHTTLAAAVVRAAALTLRKRPRICYTCHGYLFREADGLHKWAYLLPEKLCARVTDRLLVMNEEDAELARRHRLGRSAPVLIDGMGFAGARFAPLPEPARRSGRAAAEFAPTELVFVYAAEFSTRKNQALLLRAFARVAGNRPEVRLILAGDGALLETCKTLARTLGVAERVRFPGRVSGMAALYPLCDGVVSASRSEGLPFHLMEAMACGLPAAVTDIKGHRELVEDGETGILCPPEDAAALGNALERLCADPALRARYGAAARQKAARFTLERVLPRTVALYEETAEF